MSSPRDAPDDLRERAARFRAFNRPLTWLSALFAMIYLGAGVALSSGALIACGVLAWGLVGACLYGGRAARAGHMTTAALSVGLGLLAIALTFAFLIPFVFPTLVMMPIAAVALTLPDLSGRPLRAMVGAAFVVSVVAALAGTLLEHTLRVPEPFRIFVLVSTIAIDVGLTTTLLLQYSTRLRSIIEEQRRTTAELRLGAERLRSLTLATTQAVWATDREGRVHEDSPTWRAFTGQTEAEWLEHGWLSAVHPEDRERVERAWRRSVATGEPYAIEYRLARADGGWADTVARAIAVRNEDGSVREWVGTTTDVSETTRAQRELEEEARRKDELLAMLGHELRNPLAPIRSAVSLLQLRGNTSREVAVIDRQVTHLGRLVDDLLDVSRISRGKIDLRREVVDLRTVVDHALTAARPMIDAREHRVVLDLPETPVAIDGDSVRLEQVVINVLGNAAKYTPVSGTISITLAVRGASAVLRVRDDGVGIDPDLLPHVFDCFRQHGRTLDRAQGGLGLGLTLARWLTELHGGHVVARSEGRGRGAEIEIELPLHGGAPALSETVDAGAVADAGGDVLVVDDNPDAADLHAALLEQWGYHAIAMHDPESALEHVARSRPRVALLDIGLPRIDGYELARRIRVMPGGDRILLVALTGYGQAEDRARSHDAGFDAHLTKPADPETLRSVVSRDRAGAAGAA